MSAVLKTPQGLPTFPGWRYPPVNEAGEPGEAKLFNSPDDVPEGWTSHPLGAEAEAAASFYESKVVTSEGMAKFPGWRLPPGATSMAEAVLFHSYADVPPGFTEGLVDPDAPALEAPKEPKLTNGDLKIVSKDELKAAATAKTKAAKDTAKAIEAKPKAPVAPLTREEMIAKLVAEFGYQLGDADMAAASDDAVANVLKDEEAKRGHA